MQTLACGPQRWAGKGCSGTTNIWLLLCCDGGVGTWLCLPQAGAVERITLLLLLPWFLHLLYWYNKRYWFPIFRTDKISLEYTFIKAREVIYKKLWAFVAQSCPTLCDPMDCSPSGSSVHGDSPGKNRVGCHFLLQGIFPTQGSNPGLPHCRRILYRLSHQGSPWLCIRWSFFNFPSVATEFRFCRRTASLLGVHGSI